MPEPEGMEPAVISDFESKYMIEEMKAARVRIEEEIKAINQFEVFSLTVIGAMYFVFFQFKIQDAGLIRVLSLLPVAICLYGIARYTAHRDVIRIHEEYVKKIEEKVFVNLGGLVSYYDREKASRLKYARYLFWSAILGFAVIFSFFAFKNPEYVASFHKAK